MATPADQRLLELLDKWLKSLELHAKYSSLDDDSYWQIQPWVEHQRPTRWIIDLALQKTRALRTQVEERMEKNDASYSDSLELMIFLANLVGSEHIERFIPVAEAQNERALQSGAAADGAASADAATGTREMPKFLPAKRAPQPSGTTQVARSERKPGAATEAPAKKAAPAAKPAPKPSNELAPIADGARELVIDDAARLVHWGRKWYELPELIARMAGRPPLAEVRRILKENKAAIDNKAGGT
jgi:hypothetical protein